MKYLGNINGLAYTLIGTCASQTVYGGFIPDTPWACFVNGYFSVLFICIDGGFNFAGWIMFSYDGLGGVCVYRSANWRPNSDIRHYGTQIIQSGNNFVSTDAGQIQFRVPTVFKAGQTYIVPTTVASPPPPCGTGTLTRVTYLDSQKLTAYEYVNAHPDVNQTWASVYLGTSPVGGGFIGNYPSTYEPFYRVNLSLPPNISNSMVYYKNGSYVYANGNSVGYQFQRYGYTEVALYGDATTLTCGAPNPNVFIGSSNSFYVNAQDYNIPAAQQNYNRIIPGGASDTPEYFMLNAWTIIGPNFYNGIMTKDQIIAIQIGDNVSRSSGWGLSTKQKKLYWVDDNGGGTGKSFNVTVTNFDPAAYGIAPLAFVQETGHNGLVNMNRAISIDGSFIT